MYVFRSRYYTSPWKDAGEWQPYALRWIHNIAICECRQGGLRCKKRDWKPTSYVNSFHPFSFFKDRYVRFYVHFIGNRKLLLNPNGTANIKMLWTLIVLIITINILKDFNLYCRKKESILRIITYWASMLFIFCILLSSHWSIIHSSLVLINSDIIYDKNRTYKFWTDALYIHVGQRVSQC